MSQSFATVLQTDLRTLSTEARKKHTEIKDAAERAIMKLQAIAEQGESDQKALSIAHTDDVLHPFMLSIDSKNAKLILIAVTSLQKLLAHNAVSPTSFKAVVAALASLSDSSDEVLQLKVVQSLLALLSMSSPHDSTLMQALDTVLKLNHSKYASVQGSAQASLRQIVGQLFDRVALDGVVVVPPVSVSTTPPSVQRKGLLESVGLHTGDAHAIFQDVCLLANGDSPKFLQTESLSPEFSLEILETVLDTHVQTFRQNPVFTTLLREAVCRVLIKVMSGSGRSQFSVSMRLLQTVSTVIREYGDLLVTECEIFLSMLVKNLDGDNPIWLKTATMEVIRTFTSRPQLLQSFFVNYDMEGTSTKVFQEMVNQLSKFVQTSFVSDEGVTLNPQLGRLRCLEDMHDNAAPVFAPSYSVSLAAGGIVAVIEALAELRQSSDKETCAKMTQSVWWSVMACVSFLMSNGNDDTLLQNVLKAYQSFTQTCGVLGLSTPRDAFLQSLCKFSLPSIPDGTPTSVVDMSVLSPKNVLSMKTLLNIAHCFGSLLDTAWKQVLVAFETLDRIINNQKAKEPTSDVNVLSIALAQLFESSAHLDDAALMHLIRGLISVSVQSLESPPVARTATGYNPQLFGMSKLMETSMHNVSRIMLFWDEVAEHLLYASSHKSPDVRAAGVEFLSQIVVAAIHSISHHRQKDLDISEVLEEEKRADLASEPDADLPHRTDTPTITVDEATVAVKPDEADNTETSDSISATNTPTSPGKKVTPAEHRRPLTPSESAWHHERRVVQALCTLYESSHADARSACMNALFNLLQAAGQDLVSSWPLILGLLEQVAANDDRPAIQSAFKSVLFVCNDFLSSLPVDSLEACIKTIGRYCALRVDVNMSLTAVGLLWNIADYLKKEQFTVFDALNATQRNAESSQLMSSPDGFYGNLWLHIFAHMETLSSDPRSEVRNCAVRTLFSTLTTHGNVLVGDTWHALVWGILFPVLDVVHLGPQRDVAALPEKPKDSGMVVYHHTRNTVEKQWDETRVLALHGVLRVFRAFGAVLSSRLPGFGDAWNKLLKYAGIFACMGSAEVTVATVNGMMELLIAEAARPDFDRGFWEQALDVWDEVAAHVCANTTLPDKPSLTLVDALGQLYTKTTFSSFDELRLLKTLDFIALRNPHTRVQKAALELMQKMPPLPESVFVQLFSYVQHYMQMDVVVDPPIVPFFSMKSPVSNSDSPVRPATSLSHIRQPSGDSEGGKRPISSEFGPEGRALDEHAEAHMPEEAKVVNVSFMKAAIGVAVEAFHGAEAPVQAKVLVPLLESLVKIVMYQRKLPAVWGVAVTAISRICADGVPSVNKVGSEEEVVKAFDVCVEVLRHVCDFEGEAPKDQEPLCCSTVSLMVTCVLPSFERVSDAQRQNLLDLLFSGSHYDVRAGSRETLAEACLGGLFQLCRGEDRPAILAGPLLLQRCTDVLTKFAQDDRTSGSLPLPRVRLAEVSFVLQQLPELESPAAVFSSAYPTKKALLLKMYPALCDCITTKESDVGALVADAMRIIGVELKLNNPLL